MLYNGYIVQLSSEDAVIGVIILKMVVKFDDEYYRMTCLSVYPYLHNFSPISSRNQLMLN